MSDDVVTNFLLLFQQEIRGSMASPLRLGRCLLAPRALARHMARPALSRIPVPRSLGSLPPGHRSFEGERQRRGAAARGGVSARASGAVEGAGYDAAPRKASPPLLDFFATCGPGFEVRPRALSQIGRASL